MIDPITTNTARVGELPNEPFSLSDKIPHEVGIDLKSGTVQQLVDLVANVLDTTEGVGFRAVSVTDGQTLPTTTTQEFILLGKGTYYNVSGGDTIILTKELNAVVSNGSFWFVGVEIDINAEDLGIVQTIRQGFLETAPSENVVYNEFAKVTDLILNQYASIPSDWSAQSYVLNSVVFYGGKQWIAKMATVAGDVPAVSQKWEEITFESLANKIPTVDQTIIDGSTNAVSGNAVYDGLNAKAKRERIISKVEINNTVPFRFLGDSYTEGYDASDRTKTSFAQIIKTTLGLTNYLNSGTSGVGSIYTASVNNNIIPSVNKNYVASVMVGFNDIFTQGTDPRILKQIGNSYRSILANHFLSSAVAGNNGAIIYSGAWSDVTSTTFGGKAVNLSGLAKTTNSIGATATYSFTGDNLVIGTKATDETILLDSFTVTIDGVNKGTFNFNNQRVFFNDEPAPLSGHEAMSVVKFNDIGSGAHTVVITKGSNASASLVIDYIGIMAAPFGTNPIVISDIPMMNDTTINNALVEHGAVVNRDFIQQCNDVIYNELLSFQGYPIAYCQTNLFFDPFDNQIAVDGTHPNDKGHQRIAEAILAQLSPAYKLIESQTLATNPLLSGSVSISGGNEVILSNISRVSLPDANTLLKYGVHGLSNIQSGSINYPLAQAGGGIRYVRSDSSAFSHFEFWKENSVTDALYFRTGSGTSTFNPWKIVASTSDLLVKANLAGGNTFSGVQTFSSSPVVPNAVNANEAVNKGQLDAAASSGSYTPTPTNVANVASFGGNLGSRYTKIGNIVTVTINIPITATANATLTQASLTLPSGLNNVVNTAGFLIGIGQSIGNGVIVHANIKTLSATTVRLEYTSLNTNTHDFHISFSYQTN